jgi:hypothetical protein
VIPLGDLLSSRLGCVTSLRSLALLLACSTSLAAQQVVDASYSARPRGEPAFARGRGPVILIDEAHHNLHTATGRYRPFAKLAEADGFVVRSSAVRFDSASLAQGRVLVIANAVAERNRDAAAWRLPVASAFDPGEVAAVVAWVKRGGSLLLIADHMPFAGAADSLGASLGVFFANGFAIPPFGPDTLTGDYPIVFRRGNASLGAHAITMGRTGVERIDSIVSFTGSAFRLAGGAAHGTPLMRLPRDTRVKLPVQAWQFSDSTAEIRGDDLLQGAVFSLGRGRVAVFGEAAMFSAQRKGAHNAPMGMNAPAAVQNAQFVLNTLRWLASRPGF